MKTVNLLKRLKRQTSLIYVSVFYLVKSRMREEEALFKLSVNYLSINKLYSVFRPG